MEVNVTFCDLGCATLDLNYTFTKVPPSRKDTATATDTLFVFQAVLFYFVLARNYRLRYSSTKLQDSSFSV